MIGFIHNASWSRHYAIGEIVSIGGAIKRDKTPGHYHEAKLRDGDTIYLDALDVERLENPVVASFPATPGYSTIHFGTDEKGEDWLCREPVMAWQLTSLGEMIPVTIRGPNDNMFRSLPVEKPDGGIWSPEEDAIYDNIDVFRAAQRGRDVDARPATQPGESA